MRLASFTTLTLTLSVAACDGSVVTANQTSGTTSGAGGAPSGGGPVASASSAVVGPGGSGGAPSCLRTDDTVDMELATPDGLVHGCKAGTDIDLVEFAVEGRVVSAEGTKVVVDACSPAEACEPILYTLTAMSGDMALHVPLQTFVTLRFKVNPFACAAQVELDNLLDWKGLPNPILPEPLMFFYAADGTTTTFADTPFRVDPVALGCHPPDPGCGPIAVDEYALSFRDKDQEVGDPALVMMGDMEQFTVDQGGSGQDLSAYNLRSFETGECDKYTNWAFWVTLPIVVPADR